MLSYQKEGSGLPIVLLHPFPLHRSVWTNTMEIFKRHFQVITIDFPGFGQSAVQKDTSTMEDMAREVLLTLDEISIKERFVVLGVSMGGYVLFQLHKMAAERLRSIIFVSTRSAPDTEEVKERRKKTIEAIQQKGLVALADQMLPVLFGQSSSSKKLPAIEEVRKSILEANSEGVCSALRGMAIRPDSTHYLQTINIPTLVISGDEDMIIPSAEMSLMSNRIPRSRFERIAHAGHLPHLEQSALFHDSVLQFLKRTVL